MKRRTVIQTLTFGAMGAIMVSSCNFAKLPPLKVYDNLTLNRAQRIVIEQLSNLFLPTDNIENYETNEPRLDFILTMLNDIYSKKDIEQFQVGLTDFQTLLKEQFGDKLTDLSPEQTSKLFSVLEATQNKNEANNSLHYFYDTIKNLSQQHFTSSELFMKQVLDFKFIPNKFQSCVPI